MKPIRILFALVLNLLVAVSSLCAADAAQPFTVVLIPDTQNYSCQGPENNRYAAQMQWIADNAEEKNIVFAIHLGDIVDHAQNREEWVIADSAMKILDDAAMPYSVLPGNHDMHGARDAAFYNEFFSPKRFEGKPWYRGSFGDTNESNYCLFSAGGIDFLVLSLEPLPRDEVVEWARTIIAEHPERRVILATHIFLSPKGERIGDREYGTLQGNSPNDLFEKLAKPNKNVFLVVCGHLCYEAMRVDENDAGKPVYQVLSDYQSAPNGGDGWLRLMEFQPGEKKVTLRTYSPVLEKADFGPAVTLDVDFE